MKVSLNTVKQFIDFELPSVDELVARINQQLGGVEEVIDLADRYKDAKIVKVVECEKHPNADKLSICKIDAGTGELITVVCGAPNVHADMWAVWLPPKSIVPSTYADAEPFKLGARELRGVMSNGMLAAGDELAINSDHDGILEINPSEWRPNEMKIEPGLSFAKVFGLDDTIIDIENKMFTHRPDLFGQLGVAREIAGILGHAFTSPSWYLDTPAFETGEGLALETFNEAGDKVPRVMFVAMKNIDIKPSPLWLQCALVAMGGKPINNIVDVTNYIMLLTAQPTHAYDYDKLRGSKIVARMAKKGETIKLINDKIYQLSEDDIVIADGEGAIGLGGIMGGGDSEVTTETRNIVLEVATFDMYTVRKSSMRHGIFTDALTRFNKGQSPLQNNHIMNLLMMSLKDVSSVEQASEVFDLTDTSIKEKVETNEPALPQSIAPKFIRDRLGVNMSKYDMVQMLGNVEFPLCEDCGWDPDDNEDSDDDLHVNVPFWRTDIELPEDVVEEIGRLYGFDKLPRDLPTRSIKPVALQPRLVAKNTIRDQLSRAGANEALTYSFVHENVLKRAGQNAEKAYQLGNALSPDLQYYRLSLTPSLLDKINMNVRAGYDEFALYELGKAHHKDMHDDEGLPKEFDRIALVYANKKPLTDSGAAYFKARTLLMSILDDRIFETAITFTKTSNFELPDFDPFRQMIAPFEAERSAIVMCGDMLIGVVGEYTREVVKGFKLPEHSAGFEVFLSPFVREAANVYQPLSKYPALTQDISLKVTSDVEYETVFSAASSTLQGEASADYTWKLSPLSIYQDHSDHTHKTITLRLVIASHSQTLRDADVTPLLDKITESVAAECGAQRV